MGRYFTFQNFLIFILLPLISLLILSYFSNEVNPDGVSYMSIAQKYRIGNFKDAVNGYWSPLISWTLVPFLLTNIPPVISFKIHSILCMVFLCVIVSKMLTYWKLSNLYSSFVIAIVIVAILPYPFIVSTPDILLLLVLLAYMYFLFSENYLKGIQTALLCGGLGGLAYLSKAYAFYFFIFHFSITHLLLYLQRPEDKKQLLKNLVAGLAVFLLVSIPWITIISFKYNELTISTAGKYNLFLRSPGQSGHQVMEYAGFLPPSNPTAISIWEDPAYLPVKNWSPLDSKEDLMHFLKNFKKNLFTIYSYLIELSPITIGVLLLLLGTFLSSLKRNRLVADKLNLIFITVLIYVGGYALLLLERRYLLPAFTLILIATGVFTQKYMTSYVNAQWKKVLLLFCAASTFILFSYAYLVGEIERRKKEDQIAKQIVEYHIKGRVAADLYWYETLYACFHLQTQFYGIPEPGISKEKLFKDLKKHQIDYFIDYKDKGTQIDLSMMEDITRDKEPNFRIYKIKKEIL